MTDWRFLTRACRTMIWAQYSQRRKRGRSSFQSSMNLSQSWRQAVSWIRYTRSGKPDLKRKRPCRIIWISLRQTGWSPWLPRAHILHLITFVELRSWELRWILPPGFARLTVTDWWSITWTSTAFWLQLKQARRILAWPASPSPRSGRKASISQFPTTTAAPCWWYWRMELEAHQLSSLNSHSFQSFPERPYQCLPERPLRSS